jgi:hypothetical protein
MVRIVRIFVDSMLGAIHNPLDGALLDEVGTWGTAASPFRRGFVTAVRSQSEDIVRILKAPRYGESLMNAKWVVKSLRRDGTGAERTQRRSGFRWRCRDRWRR